MSIGQIIITSVLNPHRKSMIRKPVIFSEFSNIRELITDTVQVSIKVIKIDI